MQSNNYLFSIPIQIKMSDLDPFNHVNNGIQCNYFDYGRSSYFEYVFGEPIDWLAMDMVIVHLELDFLQGIEIHDHIICESKVYELGNKSFKMTQQLRDSQTNIVKTVCKCVISGFDRSKHISIPIQQKYKDRFKEFEQINS